MDETIFALAYVMIDSFALLLNFILFLLASIGYAMIFKKCGIKRIFAFIPVYREYCLSTSIDLEDDGRMFCIFCGSNYLIAIMTAVLPNSALLNDLLLILRVAVIIASQVYTARIALGLCHHWGRKRYWVVLWVFCTSFSSLYWGIKEDYLPMDQDKESAAKVSGATAEKLSEGLTLNLKERKARQFLQTKTLLKDIHFSIPNNRMVLLLGGSGAGKTTLLNALTGYEKANAVSTLNGKDIYQSYNSMKYDIGFVPQADLVRGTDTVRMTLRDAAKLRLPAKMSRKEKRERIDHIQEVFGLDSVSHSLSQKLSGGQRKRLSIAMEFISDPSLFILDEPDSGLDGVMARELFKNLRRIADDNKIVIVITHSPDRVADLFDDVIVLAKDADRIGRLAYYGSIKDSYQFFNKKSLEEILLSINQKDEGGEGMADHFIELYGTYSKEHQIPAVSGT